MNNLQHIIMEIALIEISGINLHWTTKNMLYKYKIKN